MNHSSSKRGQVRVMPPPSISLFPIMFSSSVPNPRSELAGGLEVHGIVTSMIVLESDINMTFQFLSNQEPLNLAYNDFPHLQKSYNWFGFSPLSSSMANRIPRALILKYRQTKMSKEWTRHSSVRWMLSMSHLGLDEAPLEKDAFLTTNGSDPSPQTNALTSVESKVSKAIPSRLFPMLAFAS
ncbi:hypothetical protein CIHG_00322 [Coccidioides immitis H538.4]|uniref:Uncharacterized protein n=3 Tax=Coccidioides immitis TaxID=5501 RepID=A0A0J8QIB8_COCIT|nr:hypothetical protein CIRG_07143 [Coccidioides immitis RMSCC 2394]KMU72084.1 hypothetical protein CISG_00393 [Coccidioides immitis RMSCC 3703]KMU82541.1 hypothetical protein CIHG_00322 [Coccidioides immitis H538.4]